MSKSNAKQGAEPAAGRPRHEDADEDAVDDAVEEAVEDADEGADEDADEGAGEEAVEEAWRTAFARRHSSLSWRAKSEDGPYRPAYQRHRAGSAERESSRTARSATIRTRPTLLRHELGLRPRGHALPGPA